MKGRTIAELLLDETTDAELREALRHNLAVLAISPEHTLEEARELLRTRLFVASSTTTRARLRSTLETLADDDLPDPAA